MFARNHKKWVKNTDGQHKFRSHWSCINFLQNRSGHLVEGCLLKFKYQSQVNVVGQRWPTLRFLTPNICFSCLAYQSPWIMDNSRLIHLSIWGAIERLVFVIVLQLSRKNDLLIHTKHTSLRWFCISLQMSWKMHHNDFPTCNTKLICVYDILHFNYLVTIDESACFT